MNEKIYIVFSGTASVGKTTLIKPVIAMLEEAYGEPVEYITEVARSLAKKGYVINKNASSATQRLIEDEYQRLEEASKSKIMVADRSIIDRFSYAMLNDDGSSDDSKIKLLDWYDANIKDLHKKYSHIFHIPLAENLKLELDGIRSPDESYRKEIDRLQRQIINTYNIPVHTLVGSTEERLKTIKKVMEPIYGFGI